MYEGEHNTPIVIDNGSGMMKAGFGFAKNEPQFVFPNVVGTPKYKDSKVMFLKQGNEELIGEEAVKYRGILTLRYPMKNGVIQNFDDMLLIWDHIYNLISCPQTEHPVLLTEAPLNPRKNRKQMLENFFEKLNVPSVFVAEQAILALYATGRTNGVVLDSGHGVTHCVPVFEGFSLRHAITRMDLAGGDVTDELNRLLKKDGVNFHTTSERQIVQDIKEKLCCINRKRKKRDGAPDVEGPTKYTLPDGEEISISRGTLTSAPEVLFNPSLIGLEYEGVHHCIADSIAKSDMDLQRVLYSEIGLSGGSTMFKGFGERLVQELSSITDMHVKVHAPVDRTLCTWMGGSILTGLHTFKDMWMTRKHFDDSGINGRRGY